MKIKYTDHSLDRIRERGITKKEVEEALHRGGETGAKGDKMRASLRNKNGNLIVIYNIAMIRKELKVIVVTAYYE